MSETDLLPVDAAMATVGMTATFRCGRVMGSLSEDLPPPFLASYAMIPRHPRQPPRVRVPGATKGMLAHMPLLLNISWRLKTHDYESICRGHAIC